LSSNESIFDSIWPHVGPTGGPIWAQWYPSLEVDAKPVTTRHQAEMYCCKYCSKQKTRRNQSAVLYEVLDEMEQKDNHAWEKFGDEYQESKLSLRPLVRAGHASRQIEEDAVKAFGGGIGSQRTVGAKFAAVSRAVGAKSKSMASRSLPSSMLSCVDGTTEVVELSKYRLPTLVQLNSLLGQVNHSIFHLMMTSTACTLSSSLWNPCAIFLCLIRAFLSTMWPINSVTIHQERVKRKGL
jgi:hypothetical protein